jgi:hypothetical protein
MIINDYDKLMEYFKSFTPKKNVLLLSPGPTLEKLGELIQKIDLDDTYIVALKTACFMVDQLNLKLDILALTPDTYEKHIKDIVKIYHKQKIKNPNLKVITLDHLGYSHEWQDIHNRYIDQCDGFMMNYSCCYGEDNLTTGKRVFDIEKNNKYALINAHGTSSIDTNLFSAIQLKPTNIITLGWDNSLKYYLTNESSDTIWDKFTGKYGLLLYNHLKKYYNINIYKYSSKSNISFPIYNLT